MDWKNKDYDKEYVDKDKCGNLPVCLGMQRGQPDAGANQVL